MFSYSKTNDVLGCVNRGGAPVQELCIKCMACCTGEEQNAAAAREKTADTGFPKHWQHSGTPISYPQ